MGTATVYVLFVADPGV